MATYDNERGPEIRGLGPADLLGLTPQSQFEMAKWRVLYSPGMYSKAAAEGLRWPGTTLIGSRVVRGAYGAAAGMAEGYGRGRTASILRGAGTFFGGYADGEGPSGLFGRTSHHYRGGLDRAFSSGRLLFTPGGFAAETDAIARSLYRRQLNIEGIREGAEIGGRTFRNVRFSGGAAYGTPDMQGVSGFGNRTGYTTFPGSEQRLPRQAYGEYLAENKKQAARAAKGITIKYTALRTMGVISTAATVGLAFELASLVGYGAVVGATALSQKLVGANFMDFGSGQFRAAQSQGASTERQRALQSIQAHHLNARRFIGSEAALMHM